MCLQGPDTHPRKQGCRHRAQTQGATCTWGQSRRGPEPGAAGEPPPRPPHSVRGVHEDWGRGSSGGDEEGRPHSRAAADPAQGTQPARRSCRPPSTGTREPWQGHAHANRAGAPEARGGRWGCQALRNMMGWGQRPEGSARPGCWRHRAGQGLRTRPGWTGGSGRRTQGRDGHSAGDKEVTWGCRVLSRLPEPA